MLQFDQFDGLNKDPATYPKFSQAVADSAREETLKTLVDLLVVKKRDYRDLFTSNETFINRPLAAVYNVPYASSADWAPYVFEPMSERAGILTEVGFLSVFSHPGASSPTKRGVKLHEIFMCQPTPDPPANVDFSKVQALDHGTVRTRLLDHMTNEGCSICHRNSDPPGLTLEHFDGLGQLRTTENGKPIDVSADINGAKLVGAQGLGQAMRTTTRAYPPAWSATSTPMASATARRWTSERRLPRRRRPRPSRRPATAIADLMTSIAASPEFFSGPSPAGGALASAATRVAAAQRLTLVNGVVR